MSSSNEVNRSQSWDAEYGSQGIPSSWRTKPSTVVQWALANFGFCSEDADPNGKGRHLPRQAIDIGCGSGRNSFALADMGVDVTGVDYSQEAIRIAGERKGATSPGTRTPEFRVLDIRNGLDFPTESVDLVLDCFVYFHILETDARKGLRHEIKRILRSGGILLTSLAPDDDGFYAECPEIEGWQRISNRRIVVDSSARIANLLMSYDEVCKEWADVLTLAMTWRKAGIGLMHGRRYDRRTLATLWVKRDRDQEKGS